MKEYIVEINENSIKLYTPYSEEPFCYDDVEDVCFDLGFLLESEVFSSEKESK